MTNRAAREGRILAAIDQLRPESCTYSAISALSGFSAARTMLTLAEMEQAGTVTAEWVDMPEPRLRTYHRAEGSR